MCSLGLGHLIWENAEHEWSCWKFAWPRGCLEEDGPSRFGTQQRWGALLPSSVVEVYKGWHFFRLDVLPKSLLVTSLHRYIYIYTCYFCLLKGLGWMANGQDALLQRHHLQDIVESVHVCHTSCSSTAQVGSWFKDVANSGWCLVGLGPSHKTLQIATAKGQTNTMKHSYMRAHSRPLQMSSINIFIFVKSLEYWVRDTTTELASLEEGLANVFCSFIWVWWTFCLHIGTIKPQGLSSWWVHVCGQGVWNLARSCKIKYYCKG